MKKILVANRGEIAVRVLRACRELGIPTVAVYSEPDAAALHVQLADSAVSIGPAPPTESYLDIDAIVAAARKSGADAIHPGYGFLAENAAFAARCEAEGITFIGPTADAIRIMGDKIASRDRMREAGVPLVPGTRGDDGDVDRLVADALELPMPVMVKAAGGGGGKGMRIVRERNGLGDAVRAASREAASAFGNPSVYVEAYLENPRHIEFQIMADSHGNTLHFFERECSIQRRHQKLVEETPSTVLTPELRAQMGKTAVTVAEAIGYRNAGTVEFLFGPDGRFYFLEMNTRIQVEHPVTELVTGVDLVTWQIRVARGEALPFRQEDLHQRGHAIECRLYAEDAAHQFMPSSGRIRRLVEPTGPGVRVDSGIYEGWEVTTDYDPILSKVITWGEDREAARLRMVQALDDTVCIGIHTATEYLRDVLNHEAFVAGETNTSFLAEHFADWTAGDDEVPDDVLIAAAILDSIATSGGPRVDRAQTAPSPWQTVGSWRLGGS